RVGFRRVSFSLVPSRDEPPAKTAGTRGNYLNNSEATGAPARASHRCAIVGQQKLERYMLQYLGTGPNLSHDETEILMMALYQESCATGGLARRCVDIMDGRLKAQ